MTAVEKVIEIAQGELGYLEKASNSNLDDKTANAGSNNWTKYARDLDSIHWFNGAKNGYPWCAVFANWLFFKAFGKDKGLEVLYEPQINNCAAVCTYGLQYYRANGAFYTSPQVGDQIFFGSVGDSGHTGIVYKVDSSYVYTIEGNTSSASGVVANGGAVNSKKYSRTYSSIAGYGRPNWKLVSDDYKPSATVVPDTSTQGTTPSQSTVPTPTPVITPVYTKCSVQPYELEKGMENEQVKAVQRLLIANGISVGIDGADGEFGNNTHTAVVRFQQKNGLAPDGVVGTDTWNKLLGIT